MAAAVLDDRLTVSLRDGRSLSIPVEWFGWLARARPVEQADLTIIEGGLGLWWGQLDEGLSVPALLGLPDD